jgi:hypothetical protein
MRIYLCEEQRSLLHYGARIKKKEIETTKDCTLGKGFNGTYD